MSPVARSSLTCDVSEIDTGITESMSINYASTGDERLDLRTLVPDIDVHHRDN